MINGTKYIAILEKFMVPSAQQLFPGEFLSQDDNAPCHRAKLVTNWKRQNNITTLEWPAQSPDLNPIENLWHKVAGRYQRDIRPPNASWLSHSSPRGTTSSPTTTSSSWSTQCQHVAGKWSKARVGPPSTESSMTSKTGLYQGHQNVIGEIKSLINVVSLKTCCMQKSKMASDMLIFYLFLIG